MKDSKYMHSIQKGVSGFCYCSSDFFAVRGGRAHLPLVTEADLTQIPQNDFPSLLLP